MSEAWKAVVGYEGLYEVSDRGRVRRVADFGPKTRKPPWTLRPQRHNHGYLSVALHLGSVDGRRRYSMHLIHRLVAAAFIGPSLGLSVNHKNGRKCDNRVQNLEYVTLAANAAHSISAGLNPAYNHRANAPEIVRRIRELRAQGWSQQRIGDAIGVTQVRISQILRISQ